MELEQLIAEIARETGVRLNKADPVLSAACLNEILLNKALAKLDRQVKLQADRVTAASTQAVIDAKREAEALLTDAGDWIEKRMKAAGDAAAASVLAALQQELRTVQRASHVAVRAAWAAGIAGAVTLSALAGIALAAWR